MKFDRLALLLCIGVAIVPRIWAADPNNPVAIVNGVRIGGEMLDLMLANSVAQGGKDSPELRSALKTELIAREVLAQEAKKQNIDHDPIVKAQILLQHNSLLSEALIAKQVGKFNITEEKLRAEYKRQLDLLAEADEFQISHAVTATELEAKAIIKATKDGEAFDKLAREKSIHVSRQNGGSLGWLLVNQMAPALANVVVNLQVGSVTALPISTPEGWQVIRLDAKRKFKAPSFEDSKQQLINAVLANERAEFIQKIIKTAKIHQN